MYKGDRGDVTLVSDAGSVMRDEWRSFVVGLLQRTTYLQPIALIHRLHTVLKEVTSKTISLCTEEAFKSGSVAALSAVLKRLAAEEPPLLWVGPAVVNLARSRDAVKCAALEINKHLKTYFDTRERVLETLELNRGSNEQVRLYLYKLIFELLMLLVSNNKMVVAVYHAAVDSKGIDMSTTVCAVRKALAANASESWGERSSPLHDDASLLSLIEGQRWSAALAVARDRSAERILERGEIPEDHVTSLLHVYCKGLGVAHPRMVAITRPVNELSQNLSFMMDSLHKLYVALHRQD